MSELSFYTSEEIINELMSRTTWTGVIIRPDGDIRTSPDGVQLSCRNITPEQLVCILGAVATTLQAELEKGEDPTWASEKE